MSGFMNNTIMSVEEITSTDIDAMFAPIAKVMKECYSFGEEDEIPFVITDNSKRFVALLWKVVLTTLHKNLPDAEASSTQGGRSAAMNASFPEELSKYGTTDVEKRLTDGSHSFNKRLIELLVGSDITESQYEFFGATLDYFILEVVEIMASEHDRGHYSGINDSKTLRELYESMSRLSPEVASWTEGKGVLYAWMIWAFLERDDAMKEFFEAGVGGPLLLADGGSDDEDDEDDENCVSKAVLAMQALDTQFIDHMKQMLEVFPFQGLLEKKDRSVHDCFIEPEDRDESAVEESDYDSVYEEVMPNLFHLCKGNNEFLEVFDDRLATALEVSGGDADDDIMNSALSFVSDLSNMPCVRRVVSKDMDQDDDDDDRIKKLFTAVKHGNLSRVKALRAQGVKATGADGSQLLYSFHDSTSDSSDADEDEDEDQQTHTLNASKREPRPLLCYVVNRDEDSEDLYDPNEMVELLVKMGADVNRETICPEQYCSHVAQYTYLGQSIVNFDYYLAKALIKAGASLEAPSYVYCRSHDYDNHSEMTPLQLALEENNHMLVEQLLKAGANPNYCGDCDDIMCPLSVALFMMEEYGCGKSKKWEDSVGLLLDAGANAEVGLNIIETYRMVNTPPKILELLKSKVEGSKKKATAAKRGKKSKAVVLDTKDDAAPRRSARLKK